MSMTMLFLAALPIQVQAAATAPNSDKLVVRDMPQGAARKGGELCGSETAPNGDKLCVRDMPQGTASKEGKLCGSGNRT
ncbi:hypothetical protein QE452_000591 [Sphingomonas sp. SORGH_AS438]|nr:hypothetical protein [Sphingomonas sp. SORGH_AS_0438]